MNIQVLLVILCFTPVTLTTEWVPASLPYPIFPTSFCAREVTRSWKYQERIATLCW